VADEIALFTVDMGGDGDPAKGSPTGFGREIAGIAKSVASIEKIASQMLATLKRLEDKLTRTYAVNRERSGPVARTERVSRVKPYDLRNPETDAAMAAAESRRMTRLMRGIDSVGRERDREWNATASGIMAAMAPPSVAGAGAMQGGRERRNRFLAMLRVVPYGGPASSVGTAAGKVLGNAGMSGIGMAVGLGGLAVGAAGLAAFTAGRVNAAGESTMRNLARYSAEIAGLQAEVDVNRFYLNVQRANNPAVLASARAGAFGQRFFDQTMQPLRVIGDMASNYALLGLAVLIQNLIPIQLRGLAGGAKGGSNPVLWDSLDSMTGGLLDMDVGGQQRGPRTIRYGKDRWEVHTSNKRRGR
jgi:hypothetical protein